MSLARQIRRYAKELLAVVAIIALSIAVGGYILTEQRLRFPWDDVYEVKGEFTSGIGVTPGQGQTVNVAGVAVGEISKVELERGRALVTMQVERGKLPNGVHTDARMLLRPKTGLNDMSVELDPGSPRAPKLDDGGTIPSAQTEPDVRLDEVLATLDEDTRSWLRVMVNDGGTALKGRGVDLRKVLRAMQPTLRDTRRVTAVVADRRAKVERVVRNLRLLMGATADKDDQLARLVRSGATTFGALAEREGDLRASLDRLPGTLQTAQSALGGVRTLSDQLRPTLAALRPTVRELPSALDATDPLLRESRPILANDLRPLLRSARPLTRDLKPAVADLSSVTPALTRAFTTLNYVVNELGYNPQGSEEGYLFWLAWFAHNATSMTSTGDAHGTTWRGPVMASCSTLSALLRDVPLSGLLLGAANPVCPKVPQQATPDAGTGEKQP